MAARLTETWQVTKPAVVSRGGLVASHHHEASAIGAQVLADGGNAVDAAIATGLAIGVAEPWMSGIGGCGYMVIYDAQTGTSRAVDFGVVSPKRLDPADYPTLPGGTDDDLFGWPLVVEDRNVQGPLSIATPGTVAGWALALERFGTLPWSEVIVPAIELARRGMKVDWYATLRIANDARGLSQNPAASAFFLPDGLPPVSTDPDNLVTLRSDAQVATLERLRVAGPEDFYKGDIAATIAADMAAIGGKLDREDLAAYQARIVDARTARYRDATIHVAPGLNAGPTLLDTLARLEPVWQGAGGSPDAEAYTAYAEALFAAYRHRLETMGEGAGESCTTHLTVVDAKGNMVALTQTLLSVFGSRVMLPGLGFLMNNGIMWFDPRPGGPNAMAPGRRPLSNMCPAVVTHKSGNFALGASGGRRIFPAVMQLISFLVDHGMTLDQAFHTPRLDVSGSSLVSADTRMAADARAALAARWKTTDLPYAVTPALYACPNAVRDLGEERHGCAFVMSPWGQVAAG